MAHTSYDLLKTIFSAVSDLETYLKGLNAELTGIDERFLKFLRRIIVAHQADNRLPAISAKDETYSDILMRFVQTTLKKGNKNNVITNGLQSKNEESAIGFMKPGYDDVSVPWANNHSAFSAFYSFSGDNQKHWSMFHGLVGDGFLWAFLKQMNVFKRQKNGALVQILGTPFCDLMRSKKSEELFLSPGPSRWKRSEKKNAPVGKIEAEIEPIANHENSSRKRKRLVQESEKSGSETRSSKRCRLSEEPNVAGSVGTDENVAVASTSGVNTNTINKKRTRRRRKKKPKHPDIANTENPFYYRLPIKQSVFLHAKNHRERISPNHFLNSCTSQELFNSISNLNVTGDEVKKNSSGLPMKKGNVWLILCQNKTTLRRFRGRLGSLVPEKFSPLLSVLDTVISKHKKFVKKAKHIVDYHCPAPKNEQLGALSTSVLLEKYSPVARVYRFVRHAVCFVIPTELLGGTRNRNELLEFMYSILQLRRQEKVCLGKLMERMHCKNFVWAANLSGFERQRLIAQVLLWILKYCFMLVKSFFYVTITSNWKNRLFFYRKILWRELHRRGIKEVLDKGLFKRIGKADALEMIQNEVALGFAPLRFIPKTKSMRPIAHLGWKPRSGSLSGQSINQSLNSSFLILRDICEQNPQNLGYGLLKLDSFQEKFVDFIANNRCRELYYVKADIKECYDSINKNKLLDILHQVFEQAKQKYKLKMHVSICERAMKVTSRFHTRLQQEGEALFPKNLPNCSKASILIEQEVYNPSVEIENAMKTVQKHLLFHLLSAQGAYYHQVQGISQGSVLSSLLCNIYCGAFENEFVQVEDHELLVRQVDDYLFLTPNKKSALKFLEALSEGNDDYNLRINTQKTIVNFECSHLPEDRRPMTTESLRIRWCGMTIDLGSFCISPDFWRYEGLSFDDCVCAEFILHPGYALQRKLLHCLSNKMSPGYYDTRIVPESSIIKNLFELSIFATRVFISLCGKLTQFHRKVKNFQFLVDVVAGVPRKIFQTLRRYSKNNVFPKLFEIEFLVYSVFDMSLTSDFGHKPVRLGIQKMRNAATKKISEERLAMLTFTEADVENGPFGQVIQF